MTRHTLKACEHRAVRHKSVARTGYYGATWTFCINIRSHIDIQFEAILEPSLPMVKSHLGNPGVGFLLVRGRQMLRRFCELRGAKTCRWLPRARAVTQSRPTETMRSGTTEAEIRTGPPRPRLLPRIVSDDLSDPTPCEGTGAGRGPSRERQGPLAVARRSRLLPKHAGYSAAHVEDGGCACRAASSLGCSRSVLVDEAAQHVVRRGNGSQPEGLLLRSTFWRPSPWRIGLSTYQRSAGRWSLSPRTSGNDPVVLVYQPAETSLRRTVLRPSVRCVGPWQGEDSWSPRCGRSVL